MGDVATTHAHWIRIDVFVIRQIPLSEFVFQRAIQPTTTSGRGMLAEIVIMQLWPGSTVTRFVGRSWSQNDPEQWQQG